MLERFARKHIGVHSRLGQIAGWYGERVVVTAFELAFFGRTDLRRFTEKPKVGGLSEDQALQRLRFFKENSGLQSELQDLLAHTVKGKQL